jgi:hypothetical protein
LDLRRYESGSYFRRPGRDLYLFWPVVGRLGTIIMRNHDLAGSSLSAPGVGASRCAPPSVSCSTTGHPVYIWWGAEDACLYHDAYRASIGPERHPGSLGRPAREVWADLGRYRSPDRTGMEGGLGDLA